MSTVIGWRSFVSIRISISVAAIVAVLGGTARDVGAQTSPAAETRAPDRASSPAARSPAAPHVRTGTERVALSLPDAIRRAMAQAPEVVIAQNNIRQAEARRIGAGVIMPVNPRISVD